MVRTRSQLEHLLKDELIDELMSIEDTSKLVNLTTRFDDFTRRFVILSKLAVSKNCNRLLSERIIQNYKETQPSYKSKPILTDV